MFNYYTISLLIGGFSALISGIIVLIHNYNRHENQVWFALTVSTAIWSLGYFSLIVSKTHQIALLSNWILHIAAILIPLFYYILILILTNSFIKNKILFISFSIIASVFIVISPSTYFVLDVIPKVNFNYAPVPGPLYILFFLYFFLLVFIGILTTAKSAYNETNKLKRLRLIYTIIFTIAASVGGGSSFLTTFFPTIPPYLLILFSIYPVISGYAIFKHQLFSVKVIAIETVIFSFWLFILMRIFFAKDIHEMLILSLFLLVAIVLGITFIRNVLLVIKQREQIEKLTENLDQAYGHIEDLNKNLVQK